MKEILTERLIIRRFTENDWEGLYEYLSDEDVVRYEPYMPYTKEEAKQETINRSQNNDFWAVCLKDGKLIGNIYFSKGEFDTGEIGYVFNKAYQGLGYATESAKVIVDYAFNELNIRRIIAVCNPLNESSWKLLERLKMRREGTLIQNIYFKKDSNGCPIWSDTYEYAILKSEWAL